MIQGSLIVLYRYCFHIQMIKMFKPMLYDEVLLLVSFNTKTKSLILKFVTLRILFETVIHVNYTCKLFKPLKIILKPPELIAAFKLLDGMVFFDTDALL